MILRKISEAVINQNWFVVILEIVIVVVGVFLGLQVQEWAEDRADRAEELVYLEALKFDANESIDRLENFKTNLETQFQAIRRLAEYSDTPDDALSLEELDRLLYDAVYSLYPLRNRHVTFEELKNSGKLGLLKNPEMRVKLQELDSNLASALRAERDHFGIYTLYGDLFLIQNYDLRGVVPHVGGDTTAVATEVLPPLENRLDYQEALKSRDFQNFLLFKADLTHGLQVATDELLLRYGELKVLVDQRLAEFGQDQN